MKTGCFKNHIFEGDFSCFSTNGTKCQKEIHSFIIFILPLSKEPKNIQRQIASYWERQADLILILQNHNCLGTWSDPGKDGKQQSTATKKTLTHLSSSQETMAGTSPQSLSLQPKRHGKIWVRKNTRPQKHILELQLSLPFTTHRLYPSLSFPEMRVTLCRLDEALEANRIGHSQRVLFWTKAFGRYVLQLELQGP